MPRFVILVHDYPFLHWDFLLENGEACLTWRLLTEPDAKRDEIAAEKLPDHRLLYLEYEGPVSGGRGRVTRWDSGTFEWLRNLADVCEVRLASQRGNGIIRLERVAGESWRAIQVLDPRPPQEDC